MGQRCEHVAEVSGVTPHSTGCEDCLAAGGTWVHLRVCMTCGKVGCCDSSPNRHATAHAKSEGHPLISSYEPGEDWWYCFEHEVGFRMPEGPIFSYE